MNYKIIPLLAIVLSLAIIPASSTQAEKPEGVGKSPYSISLESLKGPKYDILPDGTYVQREVYIFYDKQPAKPDKPDKPGKGKGGGNGDDDSGGGLTAEQCFSQSAYKWYGPENYNFVAGSGLTDDYVAAEILASINQWEAAADNINIFGTRDNTMPVDGFDATRTDGNNEMMFGSITETGLDDPNIIAVTISWYSVAGKPGTKAAVEWDMLFNTRNFDFGNADTETSVMDFANIFTHEIGHAAGQSHAPVDDICNQQTMYPTAASNEIIKRDLDVGDINGIFAHYN